MISIVIPVYNGEQTIAKALISLLQQSFNDWQAIIVNDGSTDRTEDVIRSFNDPRIKITSLDKNYGRPFARQVALDTIRTPYMCMLDADDWYYPDKLKEQYDFMECNPDIALYSTAMGVVDSLGCLIKVLDPYSKFDIFQYNNFNYYKPIPHASSIIRTSSIGTTSFDYSLKYGQDQDFLRRLLIYKKYAYGNFISYAYNRENSFTLSKYQGTIDCSIASIRKLPISLINKIRITATFRLKECFVIGLFMIGREKVYLSSIGRSPNFQELFKFNELNNELGHHQIITT